MRWCYACMLEVPSGATVCPHCRSQISPGGGNPNSDGCGIWAFALVFIIVYIVGYKLLHLIGVV